MESGRPLFDQPVEILYSKRQSKRIQRFQIASPEKTKRIKKKPEPVAKGNGRRLGEMDKVCQRIEEENELDLKVVYFVLFQKRRVAKADIKPKIKKWNGWPFGAHTRQHQKALENLVDMTVVNLHWAMDVLGLPFKANDPKDVLIERLADWCLKPKEIMMEIPENTIPPQRIRNPPKLEFEDDSMLDVASTENVATSIVKPRSIANEFDLNKNSSNITKPFFDQIHHHRRVPSVSEYTYTPYSPPKQPSHRRRKRKNSADPIDLTDEYIPNDIEIKTFIGEILKEADVDTLTMKKVRKCIFRKYPDLDVSTKKEFIKTTVKKYFV